MMDGGTMTSTSGPALSRQHSVCRAFLTSRTMPREIRWELQPNRSLLSFVPSMIVTVSSGAWLIRIGVMTRSPFIPSVIGSSNTAVRPGSPSSTTLQPSPSRSCSTIG